MHAVPEFGRALLGDLGAPKGHLDTFTEIQLRDGDGKRCIPDGALVVKRGQTEWTCLVEVKTGRAQLREEQVSRYLDWARENGIDGVLTISNEITPSTDINPVKVSKVKLRRVSLHHLSWWRIMTEAIVQHRHRGVTDPDQAWLLGELIAYLDHEKSGASGFHGMGEHWVSVRTSASNETLRARDEGTREVAQRWDQFVDYTAMSLGQELGREITPARPRKLTTEARIDATLRELADAGKFVAALKIPDAVGHLDIEADLRTRKVTTSVELKAPREGRPRTRINWLLRQLKKAPSDLRIDVRFAKTAETSSLLLREAIDEPERLLSATDPRREPRSFRIAMTRKMGLKGGRDEGSFVRETRRQAIDFYRDIVQDLREWQVPAPRMAKAVDEPSTEERRPELILSSPPPAPESLQISASSEL